MIPVLPKSIHDQIAERLHPSFEADSWRLEEIRVVVRACYFSEIHPMAHGEIRNCGLMWFATLQSAVWSGTRWECEYLVKGRQA